MGGGITANLKMLLNKTCQQSLGCLLLSKSDIISHYNSSRSFLRIDAAQDFPLWKKKNSQGQLGTLIFFVLFLLLYSSIGQWCTQALVYLFVHTHDGLRLSSHEIKEDSVAERHLWLLTQWSFFAILFCKSFHRNKARNNQRGWDSHWPTQLAITILKKIRLKMTTCAIADAAG